MKLWPRRREHAPPAPRSDPSRIAVLEHDLLGIPPEPGTWAAALITLRAAGTCMEHDPADVGTLGNLPGTRILCTRCGNHLMPNGQGGWRVAQPGTGQQS